MHSRGTSKASTRLQPRRVKSSSSSVGLRSDIIVEPSSPDPDILHQHALTAANLAYERAHGLETARKGAVGADSGQEIGISAESEGRPQLGRRQSVRFTGPNARPLMTRSITRREAPLYSGNYQSPRHSLSTQIRGSDMSYGNSATAISDDFGDSDIASMPSSYRKIRKAKSMFSPGKAPSAFSAHGTPGARRHFQQHSWQSSDGSGERFRVPDPRLKRSYSFLRGVTDRITTGNRQHTTHDAAIQLARDTHLRQLEQQRLKEQPSYLKLGKRRTQKSFRRTVRSSSTNSYGTAIASPMASTESSKAGLGQKARTLSHTLKKKIKQVFRRSAEDEPAIPAQQLNARHAHYRDYKEAPISLEQHHSVPEPDAELLRHISPPESREHEPVSVDKSSRPGSVRSVHSGPSDDDEYNNKSRVTSWTNSTAANTVIMPQMIESQRLSIIKEDGDPYQPSSPTRKYGSLTDGYAKFRQPLRQTTVDQVKAERVFSALQRRMHENDFKTAIENDDSNTNDASDTQKAQLSMSTLRRTSSMQRGAMSPLSTFVQTKPPRSSYPNYQQDYSEFRESPSPQEIAEMNESSPPRAKGPLREVKSAFFPPFIHLERSHTSPFRRALNISHECEDYTQPDTQFPAQPGLGGHVNLNRRRLNGSVAGSESIYSRSPGGHTLMGIGSSLSLARSESSGEAGTAVIITSEPATRQPLIERRYSSGDLTGTFKRFMATQVTSLENHQPRHDQIYDVSHLRESGHRRENAQLDGDDVNISQKQASKDLPKQPLRLIQTNAKAKPRLSTGVSPKSSSVIQNENSPFRKSSLSAQKPLNVENAKDSSNFISDLVSGFPRKPPQTSLLSQLDQNRLCTSSNKRHTPERAERLRRLRSKSSTSLPTTPTRKEIAVQDNCTTASKIRQQDHDSDSSEESLVVTPTPPVGNQKLLENFLKGQRKELRINEESSRDPAFL